MTTRGGTLGIAAGTLAAVLVLAVASILLLNTGGANWKVLVAVWLWLLPVTGLCCCAGYAAGKGVDGLIRLGKSREQEERRANAR